MKRKLIKQAGQAVTMTLPIEWIRSNNLKPGDEIDIEVIEKDIILKSQNKVVIGSLKLDIAELPHKLSHIYINAAYAKGIDIIEVDSDGKYFPSLNQNMGFAVISQRGKHHTIRDISGVSFENLKDIFKRVFQSIIAFFDSAIDDIFGEGIGTIDKINKIDAEINKFVLFLQRSIMKMSYPNPMVGKIMFAYSFALEKIGDEVLRMWRASIQNKINKSKELKSLVMMSRDALQKSFEIYYHSSDKNIKEMFAIKEGVRKKYVRLLSHDKETSQFIMHVVKIVEDSADLTHLSLMKKLKPRS